MNEVPMPPVDRWVRLSEAAARIGVAPRLLRSDIETGVANVRAQRFGKRALMFVASVDCDALRLRLQQVGVR